MKVGKKRIVCPRLVNGIWWTRYCFHDEHWYYDDPFSSNCECNYFTFCCWMVQKMINGMTVSRWACINFSRSVQDTVALSFCTELAQMCQVSGMVLFLLFSCLFLKSEQAFFLKFILIFGCRSLIQSLLSPSTMPNPSMWRKLWSMFTMCHRTKPKERNWSFY